MDFFAAQDRARSNTTRLLVLYALALLAITACIYAVAALLFLNDHAADLPDYWDPHLFLITSAATLGLIALGSLFKSLQLRSGGDVVAQNLGGHLVPQNTTDPQQRRLLNIIEEMALAANIPAPKVYLLDEPGINAFAAGNSPADAAVGITQGALDTLDRDELQGVIAHEYSHILNGDMRRNIRLIGILFGIFLIALIGRLLLSVRPRARSRKDNSGAAILLLGLALLLIGCVGQFFGHLIQAAISRQREYLADASAVQFTRNPSGIAGALKKIRDHGSKISSPHATETSHLFFADAIGSLFATHPPLNKRIAAIEGRAHPPEPPELPQQA
ncbi:MAG: M48 family metallopeptidase [Opitutaceae bacterium]|jgi:Zn-dependent protease with chaperone function|nr:M48 family metallopeptidase [Opitutaceae bacterium]